MISFEISKLAILQVASERRFLIFDLIALEGCEGFMELISELFRSTEILKLGFAFDGDVKSLIRSYPNMPCYRYIFNMIDLADLSHVVDPTSSKQMSLKTMTSKVLGIIYIYIYILDVSLCKKMQISNWEKRPLTKRQLHYAIADSYTEVLIYDKLKLSLVLCTGKYQYRKILWKQVKAFAFRTTITPQHLRRSRTMNICLISNF